MSVGLVWLPLAPGLMQGEEEELGEEEERGEEEELGEEEGIGFRMEELGVRD